LTPVTALVTLKSSSSSGAIKAALISHQDAPWLQRKLKSLAEAKSGEELKGEVSDLTARVLELEKKVQLLKENKPLNNNNN
jgi:predicted secreted Zn-dependent protease